MWHLFIVESQLSEVHSLLLEQFSPSAFFEWPLFTTDDAGDGLLCPVLTSPMTKLPQVPVLPPSQQLVQHWDASVPLSMVSAWGFRFDDGHVTSGG